ncbi:MAG: GTPase HflX [Candidatus Zixiibacteriota bacterium]
MIVERAILVGFSPRRVSREAQERSLDELAQLVSSAGGVVAARIAQQGRANPAYLVGSGKLTEIESLQETSRADLVVFDDELSPAQIRNLEQRLACRVIDRSMLILAIFARHAQTKESRTQVELAQYQYLYPRLTGQWTHLSKQWGGIGTRGPGETQLETDRRLVARRIQKLKRELTAIDAERHVQRRGRRGLFKVVLVGYTNAGKSTLFNRLTRSRVWAADRLFCTLDATTRILAHGGERRILLTDTIGFIRKLPAPLFAAFRATLSEVSAADLIVVVIDYADPGHVEALKEVERSLVEIDAERVPRLYALNKIDLLNGVVTTPFAPQQPAPDVAAVSAQTGTGIDRLVAAIVGMAAVAPTTAPRRRARTARSRTRWEAGGDR